MLPFSSQAAAGVEDAVLDFALERVPLPLVCGADTDGVDVAVVDEDAFAVADFADGVAHGVEPDFIEAEFAHFGLDAFADGTDLGIDGGDGADLTEEGDDVVAVLVDGGLDGGDVEFGHRWTPEGQITVQDQPLSAPAIMPSMK